MCTTYTITIFIFLGLPYERLSGSFEQAHLAMIANALAKFATSVDFVKSKSDYKNKSKSVSSDVETGKNKSKVASTSGVDGSRLRSAVQVLCRRARGICAAKQEENWPAWRLTKQMEIGRIFGESEARTITSPSPVSRINSSEKTTKMPAIKARKNLFENSK